MLCPRRWQIKNYLVRPCVCLPVNRVRDKTYSFIKGPKIIWWRVSCYTDVPTADVKVTRRRYQIIHICRDLFLDLNFLIHERILKYLRTFVQHIKTTICVQLSRRYLECQGHNLCFKITKSFTYAYIRARAVFILCLRIFLITWYICSAHLITITCRPTPLSQWSRSYIELKVLISCPP